MQLHSRVVHPFCQQITKTVAISSEDKAPGADKPYLSAKPSRRKGCIIQERPVFVEGGAPLEPVEIARRAAEIAADKQASDIVMLDIRQVCSFADYFVICSGDNLRQLQAILDDMDVALNKEGAPIIRQEGTLDSGWVLLDFGPVIVHLFSQAEREYYSLERLWRGGVEVLRFQ